MNFANPYQAYLEGSVASLSPMSLVVKLYEAAISSMEEAEACLEAKNILARGKAVNRIVSILMELLSSLDFERGGEISQNLSSIYCYVQGKVLEGHLQQTSAPFREAAKLMRDLLEGWRHVERHLGIEVQRSDLQPGGTQGQEAQADLPPYGYPLDLQSVTSTLSASF